MLVDGVLKLGAIEWEGRRYLLRGKAQPGGTGYELCEFYEGICFKTVEEGFSKALAVVVFEAGEELGVQVMDWPEYEKERGSQVAKYFVAKGASEAEVRSLKDMKGRPLFDGWGRLTEEGVASYLSVLAGNPLPRPAESAAPGKPAVAKDKRDKKEKKQGKGKDAAEPKKTGKATASDPVALKRIQLLMATGHMEIFKEELDCIYTVPLTDKDINLQVVQDKGIARYFMPAADPTSVVVGKFRAEKKCNVRGTKMFGQ